MKTLSTKVFLVTLSLFSFLLTEPAIAQSKSDTEEWIESIIDDGQYRFNQYHLYDISFKNGDMIIQSSGIGDDIGESKIPLKSLGKIKLQKTTDGYRLNILCTNNNYCVSYGKYVGGKLSNYRFVEHKTGTTIMLGHEFQNDNLPERLKRALTHLVQLNGGKLIDEPF